MKDFHVDKAFIATGGITVSQGITNYDAREANLTKCLLIKQRNVWFLLIVLRLE